MDIASSLDNWIFLILLIVTVVYWASIISKEIRVLSKIGFYGTILTNGLLFSLLGLRWLNYGYFPLSNLYESLLFLAWGITFITVILEKKKRGLLL